MSRRQSWFVAVLGLVLLGAAALVHAQEQRPGNRPGFRPGGGGGFGGFGFGFGGGGGGGQGSNWLALLRVEAVQKDVELLDEQKEKLGKLGEDMQKKMQDLFSGAGNFREMSDEERRKAFEEMRPKSEAIASETRKSVEEVLLPHQIDRLKQISLQLRGTQALYDEEVAGELGLSEDQKSQLTKIREESQARFSELFPRRPEGEGNRGENPQRNPGDFAAVREKIDSLRKETQEKTLGVLTTEQNEKFTKMKGDKIDIDFSQMFRGPGGNGPGGRGPGGNRPGGNRPGGDNPQRDRSEGESNRTET